MCQLFADLSDGVGQRIALRSTGAHRGPVFALSQRVFVNQVTPAQAVRRFFVLLHYLVAFILFLKVEKTARPSREERLADFSRYAAQDPEKQKPSQVDDESWKQSRVPTIAVHLTELDKDLLGFNKALVMFPVCTNIMTPWKDPNDLLGQLVRETLTSYQASERGKHVAQSGELKFCVGHHKRDTFELGGHRYVVAACATDRPAFLIVLRSGQGSERELLHAYCAMGLSKQRNGQQALLARIGDFDLAHIYSQVVREKLDIARISTRAIAKDPSLNERLLQEWSTRCAQPNVPPSRLLGQAAVSCSSWPSDISFDHVKAFLTSFGPSDDAWVKLVEDNTKFPVEYVFFIIIRKSRSFDQVNVFLLVIDLDGPAWVYFVGDNANFYVSCIFFSISEERLTSQYHNHHSG